MLQAFQVTDPALVSALVAGAGIAAQWLAARMRIPAILLLLLAGFAAGPLLGLIDPDATYGDLLFPFVSVAVAIILFEGALTLHISDIRGAGTVVLRLITLGVAVTIGAVAAVAHLALDLPLGLAILFGAIVSVTGPTVIVPLLRAVRPSERVSQVLKWEGILIDPIGAILAVIAFQAVVADLTATPDMPVLVHLLVILAVGSLAGLIAGYGLGFLLKRHLIPEFLTTVATLAAVVLVHVLSNQLAHESGLLAVTVMGVLLANLKDVPTERILDFKESLSVLLISVLFILLAARMDMESLLALGPGLFIVLAVILFLARPVGVVLCTVGSKLTWPERGLLAWIAPRGIIAAAVSAVFALRLQAEGMSEANILTGLTFATIVVTVLLQSLTARPLARLLRIAQPEARGVLIVGGNPFAQAVAKTLQENDIPVLLADSNWHQVRQARMAGIRCFYGSPVSEQADRSIDLVGIGKLMALSTRPSLNVLSSVRYRTEFGGGSIFIVRRDSSAFNKEADPVALDARGTYLFGEDITLEHLLEALRDGLEIKVTKLTEDFGFEEFMAQKGGKPTLLFAMTPEGGVRPFTGKEGVAPQKNWRIAYLSLAADPEGQAKANDENMPAPKAKLPG